MKAIWLLPAIFLALGASCKKSDNAGSPSFGSWAFRDTTYNGFAPIRSSKGTNGPFIIGWPGKGSAIAFCFYTLDVPAPGRYKIVREAGAPDEVRYDVSAVTATTSRYYTSTGLTDDTLTLRISNGKISINMPGAWASGGWGEDSVRTRADLTE